MGALKEEVDTAWKPFAGTSQHQFLTSPVWETLYTGTRGPGKTDCLLMDFAQHVNEGWGREWRGVLFRHEYKPLEEVIKKSKKWFNKMFPSARFLGSSDKLKWKFPKGEELLFRAFKNQDDYWDYHGFEMPWIAWEELVAWPNLKCYHLMKSCNRSSEPGMPRKYRATTNPYGPGHNAIKRYFIDPADFGESFVPDKSQVEQAVSGFDVDTDQNKELRAVAIEGHYTENKKLMAAQPNYPQQIAKSAKNEQQAKAWLNHDWNIVAGGMFDDRWDKSVHLIEVPELDGDWFFYRSFDWGSSKPFSAGWWAKAGKSASLTYKGSERTIPEGSLIRWNEWYGWNGKPNEGLRMDADDIAEEMVDREKNMGIHDKINLGPADYSIWDVENDNCIASDMASEGIEFDKDGSKEVKGSGSRKTGWEKMRQMLGNAKETPWEKPVLLVTKRCKQFERTIPTLPRDEKDMDDVDTDTEDHIADESRYMCLFEPKSRGGGTVEVGGF